MVDSRYTGVGYEPPIHTEPLDTGRYVLLEDYQRLEAEIEDLKAKAHEWLPEYLQAKAEIARLRKEVHRARTDSRYWSEFNTVSALEASDGL